MDKKVYEVEFRVTLYTTRCIEAESSDKAYQLANELLDNDKYREDLIASWDDPDSGWGEPSEPEILACYEEGDASPDLSAEDMLEIYGVEV